MGMAHQTNIENGTKVQYEKPAIVYQGIFENPMGSPGDPVGPDGSPGFEPEFRAERDNAQNWLRSFVDLLRAR
jgi:hypothetical protein